MSKIEDVNIDVSSYEVSDRLSKLQDIKQQYRMERMQNNAQRRAVVAGLREIYPQLSNEDLVKLSYAAVLTPAEKHIIIDKQEVKVADLQFMIAESIENISSGTNSRQEYFSWFEDCTEIMTNMNDGYVSDVDLEQRNSWIENSYVREAEIMACLALYKSSSYYLAEERYNVLYNKLVKLRQLRSAIKESTRSVSDEEKDKAKIRYDRDKALEYLAVISLFAVNSPMWNLSKKELMRLGLYHGDDHDLVQEYDYFYSLCEPHKNPQKMQMLPEAKKRSQLLTAGERPEALSEGAVREYALPSRKVFALSDNKEKSFALLPHQKYDFDADLRYNFLCCLNNKYYERLSSAEEMRLVSRPESKKQVEERVLALQSYYKGNYDVNKRILEARRRREVLRSGNML